MDFEKFYDTLIGITEAEPGYPIASCFTGEFERLYNQSVYARLRISMALNGSRQGDHKDALSIADAYESMQKIICKKAFEYGVRYGRGEIRL